MRECRPPRRRLSLSVPVRSPLIRYPQYCSASFTSASLSDGGGGGDDFSTMFDEVDKKTRQCVDD